MSGQLIARWAAMMFVEKCLTDHLPLDQAFDQTCHHFEDKITAQDKAFIRHLGTTCLRHLGQLDAMINHTTSRKLTGKQLVIRNILRLGITQLLYMKVPAHAAVNSAVKMTNKQKNPSDRHAKGMVNAILRRIDREQEKFLTNFSPVQNLPKWLKDSWTDRYGKSEVENIAAALLIEPPFDFSFKPDIDREDWAEKLGGTLLAHSSVRVGRPGSVQALPGYEDGLWWVQDVAASLPARLLGAKPGDHVLEFCAAPGGKTAQLAASGCQVTAVDQSKRRLRRLRENMARLNLTCDVITSDAADYVPDNNAHKKPDYILLDAPCSATGTLRRHPELSRSKSRKDIEALMVIQLQLLDHAVDLLPVGGKLIYCVCSMENEEGPAQIKSLLARNPTVKRNRISLAELPGFEQAVLSSGDVQTLPHHIVGGMDGFFISRLEKCS